MCKECKYYSQCEYFDCDYYCVNADSEKCTEYVSFDDNCDKFVAKSE